MLYLLLRQNNKEIGNLTKCIAIELHCFVVLSCRKKRIKMSELNVFISFYNVTSTLLIFIYVHTGTVKTILFSEIK